MAPQVIYCIVQYANIIEVCSMAFGKSISAAIFWVAFGVTGAWSADDLSTIAREPDQLPYELNCRRYETQPLGWHECADVDGDGQREYLCGYSRPGDNCSFSSAVLCYTSLYKVEFRSQYNGPFMTSKIWNHFLMDLDGIPGDEVILIKTQRDSIIMEILSYGKDLEVRDTTLVIAAVGRNLPSPGAWQAVHCTPLASIDLNHDGFPDLLYSRTAKPDSAFERAVVAYDLKNQRPLWNFSLGDQTNRDQFHVLPVRGGDTLLVFGVLSTGNRYKSFNGFDSRISYLVALDRTGRERWRKEVGGIFFYTECEAADLNRDGWSDIIATVQPLGDSVPMITLQAYDALSGDLIAKSQAIPAVRAQLFVREDSSTRPLLIGNFCDGTVTTVFRFNSNISFNAACRGASAFAVDDMNADGEIDIAAFAEAGRIAVLNEALHVVAFGPVDVRYDPPQSRPVKPFLLYSKNYLLMQVEMTKRPLLVVLWAKYEWLVIGFLCLSFVLAVVFRVQLRRMYLDVAGVPGLDRVDSLVLVISRTGNLLYCNHHALKDRLIGSDNSTHRPLAASGLIDFPGLLELLDRSLDPLFTPVTEQLSVQSSDGPLRLSVAIYPRLDRSRKYDGKIVVIENITNKADWQRKVVLGDAAQRWMHKLKGNLATARIQLDNLREDKRLAAISGDPVLDGYLKQISENLEQTAQTARKVLRFTSIGPPIRTAVDLNVLVCEALSIFEICHQQRIAVVKSLQADLPTVRVDASQFGEVLDNLLSNAALAIQGQGSVMVSTQLASNLPSGKKRSAVELWVADTGVGVGADDITRIFTPGFSRRNSTGVGLALVKEVVESHGGSITVESELGKGTRFRIRVPLED